MGNLFSRLKKLRRRKHKPGRTGADTVGERVDSSGSLPRPEPRVAAGGHDGEGSRTSTDGRQIRSRDTSPHPESVLAGGSDNDRKSREEDVDGKEVSQSDSRLDPNAEFVVDSGPSRGVERVHPPPSTLSIPPIGEPDSAWSFPFQLLYLIVPSTTQIPLSFLILYKRSFVPTKVLNQTLPRMRRNQVGRLLRLPPPNCFSGG